MYFEDYDQYFSESFGCILLGLTALVLLENWAERQNPDAKVAEGSDENAQQANADEHVEQKWLSPGAARTPVFTSDPSLDEKIAGQWHNEKLGSQATTVGSGVSSGPGAATGVSSGLNRSITDAELPRDPFRAASTIIEYSLGQSQEFIANMGQKPDHSRSLCQCAQMHLRLLVEQLRSEANGDRAKFESLLVSKSSRYTRAIMFEGCDVFTMATLEGKYGQGSACVELFKYIKHRHHTPGCSSIARKVPPYNLCACQLLSFSEPCCRVLI